jgi:ABC-type antimicrobial peptide transport system permease subunit
MIKIICGHSVFIENSIVLSKKFGFTLETDFSPEKGDLYIVLGGHEIAHHLIEIQERNNYNFGYIILNSEQIDSQFLKNKFYLKLLKSNVVFDYSDLNVDYLRDKLKIKVFSYFYFEFLHFDINSERIYDIVFVGTKNQLREDIYNDLKNNFSNLNILFDFDWNYKDANKLTELLHKTKLLLNIPYYEKNSLETHRINKALSCGCDVISYKSYDEEANKYYEDYTYFSERNSKSLIEEIENYFRNTNNSKKKYIELIKDLNSKITPHFLFCIDKLKMLSP